MWKRWFFNDFHFRTVGRQCLLQQQGFFMQKRSLSFSLPLSVCVFSLSLSLSLSSLSLSPSLSLSLSLFLAFSLSHSCCLSSPWYTHTGWLGVEHQLTYLLSLSPLSLSLCHTLSCTLSTPLCPHPGLAVSVTQSLCVCLLLSLCFAVSVTSVNPYIYIPCLPFAPFLYLSVCFCVMYCI